jgi:hypothetical protein
LLDSDELLQEVKSLNGRLIDYLCTEDTLRELITHLIPVASTTEAGTAVTPVEAVEDGGAAAAAAAAAAAGADHGSDHGDAPTSSIVVTTHETVTIRYPYIACELICCDVSQLVDSIVSNESLLELLFSILDREDIDCLTCGYFEKIFNILSQHRPTSIAAYITKVSGGDCSDGSDADADDAGSSNIYKNLLKHIYNSSITGIIKRLLLPQNTNNGGMESMYDDDIIDEDGYNSGGNCVGMDWCDPNVVLYVTLLIDDIKASYYDCDESRRDSSCRRVLNGCDVLGQVISNLQLKDDVLLFVSSSGKHSDNGVMRDLCAMCFDVAGANNPASSISYSESKTSGVLTLLETVLLQLGGYGCVPPLNEDDENNSSLVLADCARFNEVMGADSGKYWSNVVAMLTDASVNDNDEWILRNQCNESNVRLGVTRLKIIRVIESTVLLANQAVDAILSSTAVLNTSINLFIAYKNCSLLHQSVANLLVHIIEGGVERQILQKHVIAELDLLSVLMRCFQSDSVANIDAKHASTATTVTTSTTASASNKLRLGYMGHVIIVCQAIVHASSGDIDDDDDDDDNGDGIQEIDNKVLGDDNGTNDGFPKTSEFFETVKSYKNYNSWASFVTSTLAIETSIQSTPLGGFSQPSRDGDDSDGFGLDVNSSDMDVAASMIRKMNFGGSDDNGDSGEGGGVKLGMDGIRQALGMHGSIGGLEGLGGMNGGNHSFGAEDDELDDDDLVGRSSGGSNNNDSSDEEDGGYGVNYDDIINNRDVMVRKAVADDNNRDSDDDDYGDNDVVKVTGDDSSDEEDAAKRPPQQQQAWAAFDSGDGIVNEGAPAESGVFQADFESVAANASASMMTVNTVVGEGPMFGVSPIENSALTNVVNEEEDNVKLVGGGVKDAWGGEDPFKDFEGSQAARDDFFG